MACCVLWALVSEDPIRRVISVALTWTVIPLTTVLDALYTACANTWPPNVRVGTIPAVGGQASSSDSYVSGAVCFTAMRRLKETLGG